MKNKRIVYIEELDKKKIDGDLLKDTVDGNKMNNEVLFGTSEEIQIMFKLLFFSNNLMNFDSDPGIKRRMITVFFNSKFVDAEEFDKEKETNNNGSVFLKDKSLFKKIDNDDFKNAFVHIIIAKAKAYFETGIIVPESYKQTTEDLCDENDKMRTFVDNHFDMTKNEDDKISKDEFKDMFNTYTKYNYAWTTILSDIKRCNLNYDKGRWGVYNGQKSRGIIVGLKKKSTEEEVEFIDEGKVNYSLPDLHGLDQGLPCETRKDDELLKRYIDLKDQFEKMRLEFEEYKLNNPKKEKKVKKEEIEEIGEVDFVDFDALVEEAPTIERSHKKKTK